MPNTNHNARYDLDDYAQEAFESATIGKAVKSCAKSSDQMACRRSKAVRRCLYQVAGTIFCLWIGKKPF